ncbi:nitroreductase family protein [Flexivirga meconopsidis]|uniref:nitroreductase family protein n=1 Tax=Flexivirga meconopsidis TaxID=2977121 RepID=UPI00223FC132|nr:nitroreductase family protein [Flexivirga meconopsidis]
MDLLMPVLRRRWSPREFDPDRVLSTDETDALLEAARWAPSAGNSQPWAFHPMLRTSARWEAVIPHLAGSCLPWATQASLLVVNLCQVYVEGTDWQYSEFASYDLGQAVAHMTIQAHSMGLAGRQFRAFDKDALTAELDVPTHWEILTMTAFGAAAPDAVRDAAAASRADSVSWPRP